MKVASSQPAPRVRRAQPAPPAAPSGITSIGARARRPSAQVHVLPTLRTARLTDVPAIAALINGFANDRLMLPKTPEVIALAIDDFVVANDSHGRLVGCGALREYSPSLAEVSSIAVSSSAHGGGIGSALVRGVERLARARGTTELFALTLTPKFFQSLGYEIVDRSQFPEKVRRDCLACPRRASCEEICVSRRLSDVASRAA
jgi:amino-acid N-acetyltransferase